MSIEHVLVANRGEVAIRVARAAADLGIRSLGVFSEDDARALHVRQMDRACALRGAGPAAYLDADALIELARAHGCDAIHPGYGFLSESAAFAARCAAAGIVFVGPSPETLELLGDKVRARALAAQSGVRVSRGTPVLDGPDEARMFLEKLGPGAACVLKAVAGGGGRGMRVVHPGDDIASAFERCVSEARAAFGDGAVYAEEWIPRARHVEVQVIADAQGHVTHAFERECSLQRRHQKLVEMAPPAGLDASLRRRMREAALLLARAARYRNLGTFEFLVDASAPGASAFWFLEANPRLQVEHTVTEEVTGIDLVRAQLEIAAGRSLDELGLARVPEPRGFAVQARVNVERVDPDGATRPAGGTLETFDVPSGPGIRVDTYGYAGYETSPRFDSLLAKVIAHAPGISPADALRRAHRALAEFRIHGVDTNRALLQRLLERPELAQGRVHTRFVEEHARELCAGGEPVSRHFEPARASHAAPAAPAVEAPSEAGTVAVSAPLQGTVLDVGVRVGETVHAGAQLLVMEAMKMEHVVRAPTSGIVHALDVAAGDTVREGARLLALIETEAVSSEHESAAEVDLDHIRPDLAEVQQRHAFGLDANRPDAVERRRKTGQRTARENLDDLVDPGSFVEYGALVIAAQRRRRELAELVARTPGDGMICGIGRINGHLFPEEAARCIVLSYDYTVLAGTQGMQNHRKKDRMFELAEQWRLPLVLFAEGGGGRPGDTDGMGVSGLDCLAFAYFAELSGLVPLVGIVSGRCFAGNAALLGCCDVVIATEGCNIGMGGPAMIEGGGLGVFPPEAVGPCDVQRRSGVIDVAVADEAEAVAVAKRYLSYFQGRVSSWDAPDPRRLRSVIPENRLRVYDVRSVIEGLADTGSVLELRRDFGLGMITALIRVEGRPLGVIANNPLHLAGAIDSPGADKAARFMQLCDAFDVPILFLCDTPGIMVGPEIEKTALVRHAARLFVTGASLTVPFFTIVLRKGYGLGAQAMCGGSFKTPLFTVSWPTGEFGGMGLEGAVKLGYRRELDAIADPAERQAAFERMVAQSYERGKAVNVASHFELDAVIDPADSRHWITTALTSAPPPSPRQGKKRPNIDTW